MIVTVIVNNPNTFFEVNIIPNFLMNIVTLDVNLLKKDGLN